MKIGTKSVLFGAHCFFLHPWFVAWGWWKLYGFPWDPRLWVLFFVHDLGYWGKPNMDGPEGETHPILGAKVMSWLFDYEGETTRIEGASIGLGRWGMESLCHSRYFAKKLGLEPSSLCFADKLAFTLDPWWLYLPRVTATGEINECLKNAQNADDRHWTPTGPDKRIWHAQLCRYMRDWVAAHKDGAQDTWTSAVRNAK